jgi:hypothetical protein
MKSILLSAMVFFALGAALAQTNVFEGFTLIDGTGRPPLAQGPDRRHS